MEPVTWTALDQKLFQLINSTLSSDFLDIVLPYWTDFQRGPVFAFLILPLILVVIFRQARFKGLGFFALGLALMGVVDFIFGQVLKNRVARPRPFLSELPFDVILRGPEIGGFSFPSSHALDAFFLTAFFGSLFPRVRWPLMILASLTAYSRVYCGVHFPSEVFGGAIIGSALGFLAAWAVKRWPAPLRPL